MSVVSSVAAGSTVSVGETVTNQGAAAAGVSTTRFYLSVNVVFDSGDRLLDGSRQVVALPPGTASAGTTSISIPADLAPGLYYLFAVADGDGAVAEGNESNNTRWRAIQVTAQQP
jgi:trimeric autotransporter adhesin